ncbi:MULTISPECIES: hypothetical protein [unclassified Acidovorax]|uniref:hypothetical protein n=1 Tax=unclassified Acidovorax TaxID=2684926 RepID=UPI0023DE2EEB|nr:MULTISPECIES: hypothetical protein [unclassified Acidovorax]GKS82896.1 hypothetical protein AVMA1855_02110 [Acidovorax sp. SUPP1855]GKS96591.1 hypothetical protein AVAK2825_18670 [Acidovorax sp. SUPP2825]
MTASSLSQAARAAQTFTLYAAGGRVYASNVRDKLIDLGGLTEAQGRYGYALDGGDQVARDGFPSPEDALADIASTVTFLYLDGQFTALEDLSDGRSPDLSDVPQIQISLDALGHGEPAIAADI